MSDKNPENLVVDAIALSKQSCAFPIQGKLVYTTKENFLGRRVEGYAEDAHEVCLVTPEVSRALCNVQHHLNNNNLGLFIYDAYRPLRAVCDFATWLKSPPANAYELERKLIHYPHLEKSQLVALGYIADVVSRHNFGNAIDLTLINIKTAEILNMGACFDFFDVLSHTTATEKDIGKEAYKNRQLLTDAMQKENFIPYKEEYWHFDYFKREVNAPMDFPITQAFISVCKNNFPSL